MRTPLEKAHSFSSIGTFVLTVVIVALMVIPMLWPSRAEQGNAPTSGGQPMMGWLMPSILAVCLLLAGALNVLAARTRRESLVAQPEIFQEAPPLSPVSRGPNSEGRIFVGSDITPSLLANQFREHTEIQARKLLS